MDVAGETYAFDADCFFQVNLGVLDLLVDEALKFAPQPGDVLSPATRKAIDLYCGVGLFTLPLARRFEQVVGVEAQARAAEFAVQNAIDAGLDNIRIETLPVERWLENAYRTHGRVPFVLLDPPRTGLPAPALRGLLRMRPQRIAYVSCDPATLARDIKTFLGSGYELLDLAAIDMFPQTHHVETVAHLERIRLGPGIVAFWQEPAESARLSPVGFSQRHQLRQERIHAGVWLVEAKAPQLVEDALIRGEVLPASSQPLQVTQSLVIWWQGQHEGAKLLQRIGRTHVALVPVILLRLSPPPLGGRVAERGERALEC